MAEPDKQSTGEFSSYYGCYIIGMAALVFVGIIAWSGWTLYSQDKAISLITQDSPVELIQAPLSTQADQALRDRLNQFGAAAKEGKPANLELTVEELNAVIQMAPDSGFGSYREMVKITRLVPGSSQIEADLCLPLKKLKFWEGKMRYLVATGTFQIAVEAEGVDAKLVGVKIPGKEVPDGFVNNLQVWPWVAPYRKQEPLGSILKSIKTAVVKEGTLQLSTSKVP